MAAIISYPSIFNTGTSSNPLDTYNQTQFSSGGQGGIVTISNSIVSNSPVILFSAAVRNSFGAQFMFVSGIVQNNSFTLNSQTSNDSSTVNWFLIAETNSVSFPNETVFLPWYDNVDPTQICGKLTLDSSGQTNLTSKYLTNITEEEARSRIIITLNTPFITGVFPSFTIQNYNSRTGSFTISAPEGVVASNATLNYFIIIKNNNPYIPTSGSGTYITLVLGGAAPTYGHAVADGSDDPITINTTAVAADSVIIACMYTLVHSGQDVKVIYVRSSDIVPGVSFTVRFSTGLGGGNTQISWLIIKPAGVA